MENTTRRVELSDRRQPALLFYVWMLVYVILAALLRAAAFAPLYALVKLPSGDPMRLLTLLTPLLLFFIVLPLRFSFADALVQEHGERSFRLGRAFSFRDYGEKLKQSALHFFSVLKWGLPLILALGCIAYALGYIKLGGSTPDAFTLLTTLGDLGLWAGNAYAAVVNFFTKGNLIVEGGYVEGALVVAGILFLLYLVLMLGAVRNSAKRYVWALCSREDRDARVETRRRLAGRRWKQLLTALINLLLLLPAILLVGYSLRDAISVLSKDLLSFVASDNKLQYVQGAKTACIIAFCAIYLPLTPLRRILVCRFAVRGKRQRKATKPLDEATQAAQAAKSVAN